MRVLFISSVCVIISLLLHIRVFNCPRDGQFWLYQACVGRYTHVPMNIECLLSGKIWKTWISLRFLLYVEKSGNSRGILLGFRKFQKILFLIILLSYCKQSTCQVNFMFKIYYKYIINLFVYIYIYIYLYIYIFIFIYLYIYIYLFIYLYLFIYIFIYLYMYLYI